MNSKLVARFRITGLVEGVSYLLLVFIAMPFKYLGDMPGPVRYLGWAHGILFVAYCWYLLLAMMALSWPFGRGVKLMIAALVPFGTFLTHKRLVADEAACRANEG